jgi:hypothetical protein
MKEDTMSRGEVEISCELISVSSESREEKENSCSLTHNMSGDIYPFCRQMIVVITLVNSGVPKKYT